MVPILLYHDVSWKSRRGLFLYTVAQIFRGRAAVRSARSLRGISLIESDDDSAGAEDILHDNDNVCVGAKRGVPMRG